MNAENKSLRETIKSLGPWHHSIVLNDAGLRTVSTNPDDYDADMNQNVSVVNAENFRRHLKTYYPHGMEGKTVLDVACNGGGDSLMAHQSGADFVLGFDARAHWIRQGQFLLEHFNIPDTRMQFRQGSIDEVLPTVGDFDVTIFKGVFYHLPAPVETLLKVAAKTRELIIIDTAFRNDIPEDCLQPKYEKTEPVMSGIDGLSWHPGGPKVISLILRQAGFDFTKTVYLVRNTSPTDQRKLNHTGKLGRFRVVCSKKEELIAHIKPVIRETWGKNKP